MTTPPPALPPDPIVSPNQVKAAPFYWPNLIAALIAAIAIAVGSIGPWIAFMGMSRNNIGSGADGTITLILGIVAALALFALLNFGRTEVKSGRMVGLGTVAGIAGVLAFIIGFIDAQEVSSRKAEIFGTTIGPEIGWGLWMILIAGPVLAITSAIVVKQVKTIAKGNAAPAVTQPNRIEPGSPSAPAQQPTRPAQPAPPVVKKVAPPPPPPPVVSPPPPPPPTVPEPVAAPIAEVTQPEPRPAPPAPPIPAPPAASPPHVPAPPAPDGPKAVPAAVSPTPPTRTETAGRSGVRRAAPWVGGAAAVAAALAAGVWAGPYLTGGNKEAEPAPAATSTTTAAVSTTTSSAVPPSTTSTTTAASSSAAATAAATFGPFTSGDAKVMVGGQPREVRGDVFCGIYGGKVNISIGPIGNPVGVVLSEADSRVNSVSLGTVDGVMLAYLDGAANGNATATKDGKVYRITGTATGIDVKNPMQPYSRPFEVTVTCP